MIKAILMVEDNPCDVELFQRALDDLGLAPAFTAVPSGEAAIDYLALNTTPVSVILLDLKLPGMSGTELLETLKTHASLRRIPVVILTSSREEGDRMRCYDGGANSYLVKPTDYNELLEVTRQVYRYWLELNEPAPMGAA